MSTLVTTSQHKAMKSLMKFHLDMVGVTGSIPVARTNLAFTISHLSVAYDSQLPALASDWQVESAPERLAERACVGVLCERPSPRGPLPPDTVTAIWLGMGVAILALAALAAVRWFGKGKDQP